MMKLLLKKVDVKLISNSITGLNFITLQKRLMKQKLFASYSHIVLPNPSKTSFEE